MKRYLYLLYTILSTTFVFAGQIPVKLSPTEIEALFLEKNLQLIAERMNVDIADAAVIQAKVWENPELSFNDINFWGENFQFSIELSQLIQTAGKRSKLIKRETVSKEIAIQEFEDVLRGLKTELRKSIYELHYLQSYGKVLSAQSHSLEKLIATYNKQVKQGNMPVKELLRLQSAQLELENEINELQISLNALQKTLNVFINTDPATLIEIADQPLYLKNPADLFLSNLITTAEQVRPDLKVHTLQTLYHEKSLAYEKSQRVPDITISANYDRWGGVWKNFTGAGVSLSLPTFNRNQGNIKAAERSVMQSEILTRQQQSIIHHQIAEAYNNYLRAYEFYEKIESNELFAHLPGMLDLYSKHLLSKNISMLEFIDYLEIHKSNMQTLFAARKNANTQFEELQYVVGADIK